MRKLVKPNPNKKTKKTKGNGVFSFRLLNIDDTQSIKLAIILILETV